MADVRPFKGVVASAEDVAEIATPPYDVITEEDARRLAERSDKTFAKVVRSDAFAAENIYEEAKKNLGRLIERGCLVRRERDAYYIYRQSKGGKSQTGVVATVPIDDYANGLIRKHEQTRIEKELDRIRHFDTVNANTEPIFLAYKGRGEIDAAVRELVSGGKPLISFAAEDDVINELWEAQEAEPLKEMFKGVDSLYIADGHHRAKSAYEVGMKRRAENPGYDGTEEFNFFMAALFPANELNILSYNRVVRADLDIEMTKGNFELAPPDGSLAKHEFLAYARERWHKLIAKKHTFAGKDLPDALDVKILQDYLFAPLFGITDPRTDARLEFVGGSRGIECLERLAAPEGGRQNAAPASAAGGSAFALSPVDIFDLFAVADRGLIMPPKSTWFEPKLTSGLVIHEL